MLLLFSNSYISVSVDEDLDDLVPSISGRVFLVAQSDKTLDTINLSSSITVQDPIRYGTLDKTLDDLSKSIIALAEIRGIASKTLDELANSSSGVILVSASVDKTLDLSSVITGKVLNSAQAAISLEDLGLVFEGIIENVVHPCALDSTLDDLSISAQAVAKIQGSLNKTLEDLYYGLPEEIVKEKKKVVWRWMPHKKRRLTF